MARLAKIGVDYFPHYVGSRNEKTLYILKSNFGNDGYAFWYQLLEILGSQKDLSYDCSKKANLLFLSASTGVDDEKTIEILDMLADLDAIDAELWIKDGVIWCQEFADQLEPIYKKRRQQVPSRPMLNEEHLNDALLPTLSNEGVELVEEVALTSTVDINTNSETLDGITQGEPEKKGKVVVKTKDHELLKKGGGLLVDQSSIKEGYAAPLGDWFEYKRAKGQPYKTELSAQYCYNHLLTLSNGDPNVAQSIVSFSMANNYNGLFPQNGVRGGGSPSKKVPDCLMNANSTQNTVNRSTI